ncbi:MAG TPA: hypothetical protein DD727_00965, partial [Clostridiales bacterium]|nr:hypothetical protein [Clostridiales bacterium]
VTAVVEDSGQSFHDRLEQGFLQICRELRIPIPMWMKKNTRELASFRMTFFQKDQFPEEVIFERLEFTIEEL